MAFVDVFNSSPVQSSEVAYLSYDISTDTQLSWPQDSGANPLARLMDVTADVDLTIQLPFANEVSPGEDAVFRNIGANPFGVSDSSGMTVANVAVGQVMYVYLADNSTTAGTWRTILFGVGSSLLDAASLQGLGLIALGNSLAQAHPVSLISSNTLITKNDRASLKVWQGGAGTVGLPPVASVGNAFFFELRNQGTGNVVVAPQTLEIIDGGTNIQLQPGDSAFIHAGAAWYTVGRGRSTQFNFTQLVKTVDGGTDTLSSTEAANVVQKYVGALASDEIVVLPAVVQVYYVSNQTTGSHTLTFESPTPGSTVTVPANQNAILFCDGTNVINTSTTIAGFASLTLSQGSATTPPLTFSGNTNTGIFQPTTGTVGVTCAGAEVARFTATNLTMSQPVLLPTVNAATNDDTAATTSYVRAQNYAQTDGSGNLALSGDVNSGTMHTGTLQVNSSGSNDSIVDYAGTNSVAMTIVGRAADNSATIRWLDHGFATQLSAIADNGSGVLVISHAGSTSAVFANTGVTVLQPLNAATVNLTGTLNAAGLLYGRGGGAGLGQITVQSGGTPSGGADGDIVLII